MDTGFIKLFRKITEWEWFDKSEMVHIFIFLLVKANHKDKVWRGKVIKRGQFVTSLDGIKSATKLSVQTIRTCLNRLQESGEINKQTTNKYTVITLCKYEDYNDAEILKNTKSTNKQQTNNKQLTTTKNVKNNKNVKNKENSISTNKETRKQKLAQTGLEISLNNFLEMRKKIRKPATDRAVEMIKNELEKLSGGDESIKIQILDQSTMNSWQGVFPLKEDFLKKEKYSGQKEKPSIESVMKKAIVEKYGHE